MVYFNLPSGERSFARYWAAFYVTVRIFKTTGLDSRSFLSSYNNLCNIAFPLNL